MYIACKVHNMKPREFKVIVSNKNPTRIQNIYVPILNLITNKETL